MNVDTRRRWRETLTVVVAVLVLWVGVSANGAVRALALAGCVAVLASVAMGRRNRAVAAGLLLVGVLPLAIVTWWSVVTPVLAALALAVGWPRRESREPNMV